MRCTAHKQSFTWALRADLLHLSTPHASRWLPFEEHVGETRAALVAATPSSDISWLPPFDSKAASPQDEVRYRARRADAAFGFLCRLSEAIGFTLRAHTVGDCFYAWDALAALPVWHEQFGPGYAVASDGARVVLLSGAYFGCDWMLAHRTNVRALPSGARERVRKARDERLAAILATV